MRPVDHMRTASKVYPRAWQFVNKFRAGCGTKYPKWPAWCFLPVSYWSDIILDDVGSGQIPIKQVADIGRLAAIGTWRYSQGIYRIDPDVFSALWSTPISGIIPAEVLLRLPEWCVYIETPGRMFDDSSLFGYWVHLEWDAKNQRRELRLLLNTDKKLWPVPIHLGNWPLVEALKRATDESAKHISGGPPVPVPQTNDLYYLSTMLAPLISLVLYLCSDEPDYSDPQKRPSRPHAKRTRKGWRMFAPEAPRIWTIGDELGRKIRDSEKSVRSKSRKSGVRPHLREAHWHGYWTGPRDGVRRFKYHWLAPIFVGKTNDEEAETLERTPQG